MQVYVDLDLPDTTIGQVWLQRLKTWLADAPSGVTVSVREAGADPGDVVTAAEVIEFVRTYGVRNPLYNGRSVFYYLVHKLSDRLVVCCTQCQRRYGICRCEDRGYEVRGTWGHAGHLTPGDNSAQNFWMITRESLVALDPDQLPYDHVLLRRERVLAFLRHLKQQ